jgi:uncharacterized glyoxalase superfamily protein PhnB
MSMGQTGFTQAVPVLHVSDASAAEHFYCDALRFLRTFAYRPDPSKANPCYLGVARDGALLHLSSFGGDGRPGSVVYLIVDDIDQLHGELLERGVAIDMPPTNQTWGNREMYVRDPDGNSIRFVLEESKGPRS